MKKWLVSQGTLACLVGGSLVLLAGAAVHASEDCLNLTDTEQIVIASDASRYNALGESVSISGGYAVVGDPEHDDDTGVVYVLSLNGSDWIEDVQLTADDRAGGDYFGNSVGISGDTVIVGAPNDDDAGYMSGAAYIFQRDGNSWTQEAKLTASDAEATDSFGGAVAISGDYAIAGAVYDDDKGNASGSAYIFKRSGNTWTEEAKLTASDGGQSDMFGGAVALSGDYAVVGSKYDDDYGLSSGSAYIYQRSGTTWAQVAKITPDDSAGSDYFGASVSIDGDSVIVGATGGNGGGSGSAYIFRLSGSTWSQEAEITPTVSEVNDYFGHSVAVSGDSAIVGAFGDDENGDSAGAAYLFTRSGTTWAEEEKLMASDGQSMDYFGYAVSISGDNAVASAPYGGYLSGDYTYGGAAYLYGTCSVEGDDICVPDTNGDGQVTPQDITLKISNEFIELDNWVKGCWRANRRCGDYDGNRVINRNDFLAKQHGYPDLIEWIIGCWKQGRIGGKE